MTEGGEQGCQCKINTGDRDEDRHGPEAIGLDAIADERMTSEL